MEYINIKFGKLKILEYVGLNKRKERLFKCECDCGRKKNIKLINLKSGHTKSCGCIGTGSDVIDLTGKIYTWLTVLTLTGSTKHRESRWVCQCKCGKIKTVLRKNLINGQTKSCGCYNKFIKSQQIGSSNPNYNFSISDEERFNRRNNKIVEWSFNVKKKFNFKCDCCESKNRLNSHHLNGYNWDVENRYNVKNGVCLCRKCHLKFHKLYGFKDSIKKQYLKFKKEKEWINLD